MDAKYICDLYRQHTGLELTNFPLFTFKDQLFYAWKGIENIRPFHYGFDRDKMEKEMKELIDWKEYGGKHCENIYTEMVGSYLLPEKFNIDKRIVYLSAQVRSGKITKDEARELFDVKSTFDFDKLGQDKERIKQMISLKVGSRDNFKKYNFKKWKPLFWVLEKMKVVPYTFYVKYCK
jgi:hypothetical protein